MEKVDFDLTYNPLRHLGHALRPHERSRGDGYRGGPLQPLLGRGRAGSMGGYLRSRQGARSWASGPRPYPLCGRNGGEHRGLGLRRKGSGSEKEEGSVEGPSGAKRRSGRGLHGTARAGKGESRFSGYSRRDGAQAAGPDAVQIHRGRIPQPLSETRRTGALRRGWGYPQRRVFRQPRTG